MRAISLAVLVVVVVACSTSQPSNPDGGTDAGLDVVPSDAPSEASADGSDGATSAPSFCTSETPAVATSGVGLEATTTHYDLYAETTAADATEMARLLEASGAAFASWFERAQPAQRLKVKYYATQSAFVAGLAADGIQAPAEAGGYYAPSTQTAYLFKQGNPYYSHVLLVHEATHQFHSITRLVGSPPFWYMEGHAEYLSRHDWDGQCVRLGVMSLLSWEDLPAQALAEGSIDVAGIVSGATTGTRADAWSIFRYLDTGSDRAAFKAFRDAEDANTAPSFASVVAPPSSLSALIGAWLPTTQEPMKPIFTEWIHIGPASVDVDTPGLFSLAMVKNTAVSHLQAKLTVPASGVFDAGVVVAYTDDTHYVGVVHGNDGQVRTFTANGTAIWNTIGTAPAPTGGVETISVDYAGGSAHVTFNGATVTVSAPSPRAGLAANDTTARFTDVSWQ
jgi:hypothetical protein